MSNLTILRVRAKINSQNWRLDLGQIWLRRVSKTTGIVAQFRGFCDWGAAKSDLKTGCENVKLFLREPRGHYSCNKVRLNLLDNRRHPGRQHPPDRANFRRGRNLYPPNWRFGSPLFPRCQSVRIYDNIVISLMRVVLFVFEDFQVLFRRFTTFS